MHLLRKAGVAAAIVAVAFCASSSTAAAEAPFEVVSEISGDPCNPCTVHQAGVTELKSMTGIVMSSCSVEVTAQIYSDGNGEIHQQSMTGANCQTIPCNGVGEAAAETEWRIEFPLEVSPGVPRMRIRVCLENPANPNGTGIHCNLTVDALQLFLQPDHLYEYRVVPATCPGGPNGLISGWWHTELGCCGSEAIEIIHL